MSRKKIIIMMPTKNEEWILPTTLPAASQIADHIIVADQKSTDKTRSILNTFDKVEWFENNEEGHSNKVRWEMLDYLRGKYGNNNIVLNIDADEIFPPALFNSNKNNFMDIEPGTIIASPWVQIWSNIRTFRSDNSVWNPMNNTKPFMFIDKPGLDYQRNFVINDHTSRVPEKKSASIITTSIPLLHLQFVCWPRSQMKQAWYKCKELLAGNQPAMINQKYKNSSVNNNIEYDLVPKIWYEGIEVPTILETCDATKTWHYVEMLEMFDKHGISKFFGLDIWEQPCMKKLR